MSVRCDKNRIRYMTQMRYPAAAHKVAGTGLSVAALAGAGVRRVSVDGARARATWATFERFAGQPRREGRFPGERLLRPG